MNEPRRNLLVDLIIATLVDKKISMTVALANNIATVIVESFTSDIKVNYTLIYYYFYNFTKNIIAELSTFICLNEVYFLRDAGAKCPKGKLYCKYFNKIRNLKHHGLVSQQPKEKNVLNRKL